jgi:enoyl-CoA hydratase/isomerase-like protein
MHDRSGPPVRTRVQRSQAWTRRILTTEKPVIAAVNGAAAGAGFSLALMCDIVLVSDSAFFRAGFPALAAVPDLALAMTLPRAVGMGRTRELLLTNRRVEPAEAVAVGIASRVVAGDELMTEALTLAAGLAAGPTASLGLTKTMLNNTAWDAVDGSLNDKHSSGDSANPGRHPEAVLGPIRCGPAGPRHGSAGHRGRRRCCRQSRRCRGQILAALRVPGADDIDRLRQRPEDHVAAAEAHGAARDHADGNLAAYIGDLRHDRTDLEMCAR